MMNNRFKLGFYSHLNIDHQHIYKAHISMEAQTSLVLICRASTNKFTIVDVSL